ncbi:hypothetical protein P43SY_001531 [Pythium insidiosum]|uniref:WW domain-containing protein n=1 Tax=Pythium insidiosum TaxID=114742 RepID=A0AAD5Q9X0_PYTIN|nr:hypothetical protein P43SY_001531 [Pythium insidiosum]KAJ0401005.1 hypothetical protein ATCC90586_002629 [Pythium insidiosum]
MQPFQPGRPPAFRGPSYYGPPPPGAFGQVPGMGPPPAFRGMPPPRGAFLPPHLMAPARPFPVPTATTPVLPAGWTEHFTPQGVRYYYNASTGSSTYDLASIQAGSAGTTAPTVATPSAGPGASATGTWVEYTDDASGKPYYYNALTKVTTWEQPEEYRMQQARAQVEKMQSSTAAVTAVEVEEHKSKNQKKREADDRAAEMFKTMPKEDRVVTFKAFLEENEVSPQFKWQEAQRFITKEGLDSDPRWKFALTTAGEKKQAFAEYCTQAINKQNIARRRQAKRVREEFLDLMAAFVEEQMRRRRVSWDDVNQGPDFFGLRKDARWLAVEEVKDRKDLFDSFVQDVARKRSQEEAKYRDDVKSRFVIKLREVFADSKALSSSSPEEIIRQARLKLQAKQEAKQRGEAAADDSELEEGEELEDGEVSE